VIAQALPAELIVVAWETDTRRIAQRLQAYRAGRTLILDSEGSIHGTRDFTGKHRHIEKLQKT
jgi:hypothetical protein